MSFVIAIDGPAGTGKGTITDIIAKKFNLTNIDTGAMYRCATIEVLDKNVDIDNLEEVKNMLKDMKIELKNNNGNQIVFLNNKDVTKEIRSKRVLEHISKVSAVKEIREFLSNIQREFGKTRNIIMEGRDIGTVVFPDADVKIYLDADVEERAMRRYKQNRENNILTPYDEILESIKKRDKLDKERKYGALKIAEDAIIIDTTKLTIDEVVKKIEDIIKERIK